MALGQALIIVLAASGLAFLCWSRGNMGREVRSLHRQLRHSNHLYRTLSRRQAIHNPLVQVLALEMDFLGRIEFVSCGWQGRTTLLVKPGDNLFSQLGAGQESRLKEALAQVRAGEDVKDLDFQMRSSRGGYSTLRLDLVPRRGEAEQPATGIHVVARDISQEVQSRQVLDRRKGLDATVSQILRSFVRVSGASLEETLAQALAGLDGLITVDRCHLVLLKPDLGAVRWEFQWCSPGIEAMPLDTLPCSLDQLPWFREMTRKNDMLLMKRLEDLPAEAWREKELLLSRGVHGLLAFPMFQEEEISGLLLFSAVKEGPSWDQDAIRTLGILADVVGAAYQRRGAGLALEGANRRLMDIISFLPDPTFVIDADRKVVAWNRAMQELTGVPEEEMVGKGDYAYAVPFYGEPVPVLIDHFGDADLSAWRQLYSFIEVSGDTLYAESFVPFLNDGQGAYLWLTASPLYDRDGNIVGAIESLRDVTYRKKAEEALRASEQRFRSLIETMTDGLISLAADGTISFANDSLCAMLGFGNQELEGRPVQQFLPEMLAGGSLEKWPGWQLGCAEAVEMEFKRRDGRTLHLRLSPAHICDAQGNFDGGMLILSDITPTLQAQERIQALNRELEQKVIDGTHELLATNRALRRSEERYRRIIESLREGYIFYSQDPSGNFTYVSPSFRDILGYARLEDFRAKLESWLQDPRNQDVRFNSQKSRLGYRQRPTDFHVEHQDGSAMVLEVQENPVFDKDGLVVSVEGLCRDVTADRQNQKLVLKAQKQLVETEKLAAMGSLVAGLSHEINTPVGIGVTAASHLAQEIDTCRRAYRLENLTRADFESFLGSALESAELVQTNLNRAADLLQNFKLVATDQAAGQARAFKLAEYLRDVVQSLAPRFKNTGFKVTCQCPENLEMHCDPGALYQVVSNLVMNSLSHGFEGMLVGEITIDARAKRDGVELTYRDNGNGMSRQELARLYEPFYTTKRGRGGTGLGMHIVYNNVTQTLGGTITCASKPGRGTRFQIRVPLMAEVEHG